MGHLALALLALAAPKPSTPRPKPAPIPKAVQTKHATERAAFRRDTIKKLETAIKTNPKHPLAFLRGTDGKWHFDAGRHTHKRAGHEILGIEHPKLNRSSAGDRRALSAVKDYVSVGGHAVEKRSAELWVKEGKLDRKHISGPHPGWSR